jgi:RNA polymerase sigma-70 factor (sigma-E family)
VDEERREEFSGFVLATWRDLVRSAVLLGCEHHEAEDLAQATLVRCFLKWQHVERARDRRAYVARVMLNLHRQSRRRRWWRELATRTLPEAPAADPAADDVQVVNQALAGLSQEHREVVMVRILLQLSERESAEVLGVPAGTVKSRLSRALGRLALDPGLIDLNQGSDE